MAIITDFYQFKYSRQDYYIDFLISRPAALVVEEALTESLASMDLGKEYQCAYMRLKEVLESARLSNDLFYVDIKINKCYLKYIRNLSNYYFNRVEYSPLQTLNYFLQNKYLKDTKKINEFSILNEDRKINILSNI